MLVWMDLEMTGLDHTADVIVEIATLVTDDELNVVAEGPDIAIHHAEEVLMRMDPFVVDMHTRSGLLDQIRASTSTLEEAGQLTLAFIKEHVPEPRTVPLCGNSIGTDRRFLAAYLPEIEEYLHYRSVDVSSIKELVRRWYPDVLAQRGWKAGTHRALDDIRESLAELRLYRELVFSTPDSRARATGRSSNAVAAEQPAEMSRARSGRHSYGGPEVIAVQDVPDPVPASDEILVRVVSSAINRADTMQRQGGYPDPRGVAGPEILGLEFAGTVAELGARVTSWKVGDAVMGIESGACNAELVTTHERQALPVPSNVALADAGAIPEVYLTAWDALVVQGGLTSGRWALVHAGASGVGTAAIQIAKAIGARIAVTCSAGKADACRELGADLVLERSPADWAAALKEAVPDGVDVGARRRRRRRGQPQPRRGATAGNDRAGRADGWRADAGQPRAAARQARALDRHRVADAPARAEGRVVAAIPARGDPVVRVGRIASGDRLTIRARRHRRGPPPDGRQRQRRQDPARRLTLRLTVRDLTTRVSRRFAVPL